MSKTFFTYQKKFYTVLLSVPFVLLLFYFLSLKKTYNEYQKYATLSKNLNDTTIRQKIPLLEEKISENKQQINQYKNKTLLDIITFYATKYHLKITHFEPPEETVLNEYQIVTQKITLNGTFYNILQTLHKLEEVEKLNLSSVELKSFYDRKKKEEYLLTTLYIQKIQTYENP